METGQEGTTQIPQTHIEASNGAGKAKEDIPVDNDTIKKCNNVAGRAGAVKQLTACNIKVQTQRKLGGRVWRRQEQGRTRETNPPQLTLQKRGLKSTEENIFQGENERKSQKKAKTLVFPKPADTEDLKHNEQMVGDVADPDSTQGRLAQ
ncbi:unnamed protein product [Linum trigynum]|uniref:Uncharacterized protein n=1 Tax=Linum trigynum TaxID=586398 RepID=A0AAV2CXZ7_9ROSI